METKTLHLWIVHHSLTWRDNSGPRCLDDLTTQVATRSDNPADAIKLAQIQTEREGKRMQLRELKSAGYVEVSLNFL
jgi:hypothetical protein